MAEFPDHLYFYICATFLDYFSHCSHKI